MDERAIMSEQNFLGVEGIMERLPHRFPFLLVDSVVSCEPGKSIRAIKNVTFNELHFQGHFPGHPVMPGVLILEAMAQAAGILVWETVDPDKRDYILYLAGVDKSRFRRPAVPGDRLDISVELVLQRRNLWRFDAKTEVDGELIATAEMTQAPGKFL
jgi:3-hydroxyacyl-[acyl-carrier-protein] dehydratase